MKNYCGIDPGKTGGFAIIDDSGITAEVFPLCNNEIDIKKISEFFSPLEDPICCLEKVHSSPQQGVCSAFSFGRSYGEIIGMLKTLSIPYVLVTPQAWKKKVLAGMNWKGNKKIAAEFCMRKYPKLDLRESERCRVPHMGLVDALCIAEYCKATEA